MLTAIFAVVPSTATGGIFGGGIRGGVLSSGVINRCWSHLLLGHKGTLSSSLGHDLVPSLASSRRFEHGMSLGHDHVPLSGISWIDRESAFAGLGGGAVDVGVGVCGLAIWVYIPLALLFCP